MYRFLVCQEMQFPNEITQKKKVRRASSLIIASRYVPLRWHYPNQVMGRSGITLPLSRFSPAPPYVIFEMSMK